MFQIAVPYRRFEDIMQNVLVEGLRLISLKVMFCKSVSTFLRTFHEYFDKYFTLETYSIKILKYLSSSSAVRRSLLNKGLPLKPTGVAIIPTFWRFGVCSLVTDLF